MLKGVWEASNLAGARSLRFQTDKCSESFENGGHLDRQGSATERCSSVVDYAVSCCGSLLL